MLTNFSKSSTKPTPLTVPNSQQQRLFPTEIWRRLARAHERFKSLAGSLRRPRQNEDSHHGRRAGKRGASRRDSGRGGLLSFRVRPRFQTRPPSLQNFSARSGSARFNDAASRRI